MAWTERYVSVAGGGAHDGTSEANAWTLAEAIAAYAAGQRVNVKAGTYANTTTDRAFATNGTTTAPVWWRGYNVAIGDLDDVANSANRPEITFTSGRFAAQGEYHIYSNLNIRSQTTNTSTVRVFTGVQMSFDRCVIENTNADVNSVAFNCSTDEIRLHRCHIKATTTASQAAMNSGTRWVVHDCVIEGGVVGLQFDGGYCSIIRDIFRGQGSSDCIRMSGAVFFVIDSCTCHDAGSDGIEVPVVPTFGDINNCIFSECGGYGIRQSSGTNTARIWRSHNLFHSNTSGTETGFGDMPSPSEQTDASSPFEDAANGDYTPDAASNAIAGGPPGDFEGL